MSWWPTRQLAARARRQLSAPDATPSSATELVRRAAAGRSRAVAAITDLLAEFPDDPALLDPAWSEACDSSYGVAARPLWRALVAHRRPAPAGHPGRVASQILVGDPAIDLDSPAVRGRIVRAASTLDPRLPGGGSIADLAPTEALPAAALELVRAADHATLRGELADAAHDDSPLAHWCVAHGILPVDPTRRAAFLLLAGALDAYRATDPDGTLLVEAYRTADPARRARLRARMAEAGDFDVLRIVAGRAATPVAPNPEERTFLRGELVARHDWATLWQWSRHLPLLDAVAAAQEIGDWTPGPEPDQALLAHFRAVDLTALRAEAETLTRAGRITVPAPALAAAVSPDDTRVAVVTSRGVCEHSLVDGTQLAEYRERLPVRAPASVVHLGDSIVAAHGPRHEELLVSYRDRTRTVLSGGIPVAVVGFGSDGYLRLDPDGARLVEPGRPAGRPLPLRATRDALYADAAVAATPDGDLLAVGGPRLRVLHTDGLRVLTTATVDLPVRAVVWLDVDRLATVHRRRAKGEVRLWTLDGDTLHEGPRAPLSLPRNRRPWLTYWAAGHLLIAGSWDATAFLTGDALIPVDPPPGRTGRVWTGARGPLVSVDPTDHRSLLTSAHWQAHLFDHATPSALTWLERLAENETTAALRPTTVALLRARLEHRFGTDITLDTTHNGPTDTDIALTAPSPRPE